MPRSQINPRKVSRSGLTDTAGTTGNSTDNHKIPNNGRTILRVANAHATLAKTLTVHVTKTVDGLAVASQVYSVPALTTIFIGPFPAQLYNDSSGNLLVDPQSADITIAPITF